MNIRINHDLVDVPNELSTWGELLDWLETDHLKAGQCITKVALGENEEFDYRTQQLCGQGLGAIGTIDIESGDFDSVVRESLGELDAELDRVLESGGEITRLFEAQDQGDAYRLLAQYLESLRVLFTIFSEDLGWVHEGEETPLALGASLEKALLELIAAQENGFWISVCDVLEYELTPILAGWRRMVQRTRGHIH